MRLALAGFAHETVTFLPTETTLEEFNLTAQRGSDIIDTYRGSKAVAGGFIAACEDEGVEMTGLVYAECAPSGPVSEAAFQAYLQAIRGGLEDTATRPDGLLLHLHGAMATRLRQDPETAFLQSLRDAVGPDFPIGLALDLHGNLSPTLLSLADVVCGYHHSPHIDMDQTGARAARLLIAKLRGEARPVMAMRKPGIVLPSIFTATSLSPLDQIMAAAREWEGRDGVLDVSVFTGFAYADVNCIGCSVVAVADGNELLANRVADDLARRIADRKHELYDRDLLLPVPAAVDAAVAHAAHAEKPVVILEHADRMNDSTHVLNECVKRGLKKVAVPYLWDPAAVRSAVDAGVGTHVATAVGGRSSAQAGDPVLLQGPVRFAGRKRYIGTGPMRKGVPVDLGDAAVIDSNGITVILTSNQLSAIDADPFVQFGLDPNDFDIIVLRSKTHFRAVYEELANRIIIAETPDWGPADLGTLPYRNVPPGVFPITA